MLVSELLWFGLFQVILYSGISFFFFKPDQNRSDVTFMRPTYYKLTDLDERVTPLARKYSLYLYREWTHRPGRDIEPGPYDVVRSLQLRGWPVLFIHGHGGSFKQCRSFASEAHRQLTASKSGYYVDLFRNASRLAPAGQACTPYLDFFGIDFNEEFSGLHGATIHDQAQYVNEALKFILDLYARHSAFALNEHSLSHSLPDACHGLPTSILVIGHSMGGLVARTIFLHRNHPWGAVNTVVTLCTPHIAPPVNIEQDLADTYAEVNAFWASWDPNRYVSPMLITAFNKFDPMRRYSLPPNAPAIMASMFIVSVASGARDTTVNSELSSIGPIFSQSLDVYASSIPYVWASIDHHAVVWCHSMVRAMTETLFRIVLEGALYLGSEQRDKRADIIRQRFVHGVDLLHPVLPANSVLAPVLSIGTSYLTQRHLALGEKPTSLGVDSLRDLFGGKDLLLLEVEANSQSFFTVQSSMRLGYHFVLLPESAHVDIGWGSVTLGAGDASSLVLTALPYLIYPLSMRFDLASIYDSQMSCIELSQPMSRLRVLMAREHGLAATLAQYVREPRTVAQYLAALMPSSLHLAEYDNEEAYRSLYTEAEMSRYHGRRELGPDSFLSIGCRPKPETQTQTLSLSLVGRLGLSSLTTDLVPISANSDGFWHHLVFEDVEPRVLALRARLMTQHAGQAPIKPVWRLTCAQTGEVKYWVGLDMITLHDHAEHDLVLRGGPDKRYDWQLAVLVDPTALPARLSFSLDISTLLGIFVKRYVMMNLVFGVLLLILCLFLGLQSLLTVGRFQAVTRSLGVLFRWLPVIITVLAGSLYLHGLSVRLVKATLARKLEPNGLLLHIASCWFTGMHGPPLHVYVLNLCMSFGLVYVVVTLVRLLCATGSLLIRRSGSMRAIGRLIPDLSVDVDYSQGKAGPSLLRRLVSLSLATVTCFVLPYQYGLFVALLVHAMASLRVKLTLDYLEGADVEDQAALGHYRPPSPVARRLAIADVAVVESHYELFLLLQAWLILVFGLNAASLLVWFKNITMMWLSLSDYRPFLILPTFFLVWYLKESDLRVPALNDAVRKRLASPRLMPLARGAQIGLVGLAFYVLVYGMISPYAIYLASNVFFGIFGMLLVAYGYSLFPPKLDAARIELLHAHKVH